MTTAAGCEQKALSSPAESGVQSPELKPLLCEPTRPALLPPSVPSTMGQAGVALASLAPWPQPAH